MAYTINRTDGTAIVTVPDGQIDQASTDIVLIGKNFSGFGEFLNENFVKILENFASDAQPTQPLTGQLWFDVTESRIKVYSGTEWKAVGTSALATSRPLDVSTGDFWFNTSTRQLYFYDGTRDYLLGPDYTASQGVSGTVVENIEDSSRSNRTVTSIYVGGNRVGFFSTSEFTPRIAIPGFDQSAVRVGFNPINSNFRFLGNALNAESLGGLASELFPKINQSNVFTEPQTVQAVEGIRFGNQPQGQLAVEGLGDIFVRNLANNRRITLRGTKNNNVFTFLELVPNASGNDQMNIFPDNTTSEVNVTGNMIVRGDLTVQGTSVTVQSQTVQIRDKLLELAVPSSGSPTDSAADGGGIVLKGDTDHSLTWDNSTDTWNFTEALNIPSGTGYKIGGVNVLYDTGTGIELASTVTSAPGLVQFGNQINLTVDNITINNNRISNNGVSSTYFDGDPANPANIEIETRGNLLLIGSPNPKIIGVSSTNEANVSQTQEGIDTLSSTELSEATSKRYVTNLVRTRSIPLTMDITGYYPNEESPMTANEIAAQLLRICPPGEYESNTKIRISTVRYFVENISAVQPALTTTILYDVEGAENPGGATINTGVIREVAANQIPTRIPPRLYVVRGFVVYKLNPSKDTWIVDTPLVEDQAEPTNPVGGLANFIRPGS